MDGSTVSDASFTTVSAPVVANTYVHLKLVLTGTSTAEFYYNGVKSCHISTNVPSGTGMHAFFRTVQGSATGANQDINMDWVRFGVDITKRGN